MRPVRSPPGTLADRSAREKRSKHPGYLWFTEAAPETTVKRIGCFGASLMFVSMTEMAVVSGYKDGFQVHIGNADKVGVVLNDRAATRHRDSGSGIHCKFDSH
jgi:hypothetical protein